MSKEHGQVRSGIAKGCAEQDPLFSFPATSSALHVGKVIISHRFELEFLRHRNQSQRECGQENGAEGRAEEEENTKDDGA